MAAGSEDTQALLEEGKNSGEARNSDLPKIQRVTLPEVGPLVLKRLDILFAPASTETGELSFLENARDNFARLADAVDNDIVLFSLTENARDKFSRLTDAVVEEILFQQEGTTRASKLFNTLRGWWNYTALLRSIEAVEYMDSPTREVRTFASEHAKYEAKVSSPFARECLNLLNLYALFHISAAVKNSFRRGAVEEIPGVEKVLVGVLGVFHDNQKRIAIGVARMEYVVSELWCEPSLETVQAEALMMFRYFLAEMRSILKVQADNAMTMNTKIVGAVVAIFFAATSLFYDILAPTLVEPARGDVENFVRDHYGLNITLHT